jgi:hypothetical protein
MLKFVGHVSQAIPGVPARDLDDADIRALPYTKPQLIRSGLYEDKPEPKKDGGEA